MELSGDYLVKVRQISGSEVSEIPIFVEFSEAKNRHRLHISARDSLQLSDKQCLIYLFLAARGMQNKTALGTRVEFLEALHPQLEAWLKEGVLTSSLREAAASFLNVEDESEITKVLSGFSKKFDEAPFSHFKDLLFVRKREADAICVTLLGYGTNPPEAGIWV